MAKVSGTGSRDLWLAEGETLPLVSWFGEEGTRAWSRPEPFLQAQRPAVPQFPLKDGLSHEEKGEREEAEDSYLKLCAPCIATVQSPLQKTFRSTDTVGRCVSPTSPGSESPALASGLGEKPEHWPRGGSRGPPVTDGRTGTAVG